VQVRRIELESKFPGSDVVNVWYVETPEVSILIDAGPPNSADYLAEELGGADYIFLTHHHVNHAGGLPALVKAFKPIVIVNPTEYSFMTDKHRARKYIEAVLRRGGVGRNSRLIGRIAKEYLLILKKEELGRVYSLVKGNIDTMYVDVGVIPCGGHTWGHTCYAIEDMVFIGDSLTKSRILSISSYISLESTLSLLKTIRANAFYPGHGGPLDRGSLEQAIENLREDVSKRLSLIIELAKSPVSIYDIAVSLYGRLEDPLELFLAVQEVSAYVKYLSVHRKVIVKNTKGRWIVRRVQP